MIARSRHLIAAAVCGILALSACGSGDEAAGQQRDGRGSDQEGSSEPESSDAAPEAGAAGTLSVPSDDEWAAIGLSCESFDAANYDEQTIEVCIGASGQVATMVRLAVQDDQVVAWTYTGLPGVYPLDVSAEHQAMAATVLGLLNPDDAALLGQLASGGTASGQNWKYEGETKQLPGGGYSSLGIDAKNVESSADVLPRPESFDLDLQDVADTIGTADTQCDVDDGMWTVLTCDVGDFSMSITTDPEAQNQVRSLSMVSFASPADYSAQGSQFIDLLKQTGSPELAAIADQLPAAWTTGGPKWMWMEGLPMFVVPMDSGSSFTVDGVLVPPLI